MVGGGWVVGCAFGWYGGGLRGGLRDDLLLFILRVHRLPMRRHHLPHRAVHSSRRCECMPRTTLTGWRKPRRSNGVDLSPVSAYTRPNHPARALRRAAPRTDAENHYYMPHLRAKRTPLHGGHRRGHLRQTKANVSHGGPRTRHGCSMSRPLSSPPPPVLASCPP